jgi:gamma-glutamyltranspeptidase/glutathione hydrolase
MRLTRPEIQGWHGVASATYAAASQAAMRMLELGGNAFDGAVAGGFVLQAVAPHLNGPAGDVAILFHDAEEDESLAVCGQGPTPRAATIDAFRDLGLDAVPGTGLLPAVVPGAFDAWLALLAEKGTLSLETVMEPALVLWRRGVPVDARLNATLEAAEPMFRRYWPTSRTVFLPSGAVPRVGDLLRNPVAAETVERILSVAAAAGSDRVARIEAARRAWSDGFVAEAIDRFCRETEVMDVSGATHGALLRGEDLSGWRARFEAPRRVRYAGHEILKCDSWTQGPVLLQALGLLPAEDMASLDPEGDVFVHRVVEALKLSFADREVFYGDPDRARVPMSWLLSDEYAAMRRAEIGEDANNAWRPGVIAGCGWTVDYAAASARARDAGLLASYGGGEPTVQAIKAGGYRSSVMGDTCYLAVADAAGNMVSATPSGGWLQSSPAIPDLGFPLGTRAQMMWLDPAAPSAMAPETRPRSTLTPTLVLDGDGAARLACGTPGGDQQDQWQTSFLIRVLALGQGLQEAIEAPSCHAEHWPNSFYPRHASPGRLVVEGRYPEETAAALKARGHDVTVGDDWSEGRLCAVGRDPSGLLRAAANPRGGMGYAVGR